MAKGRSGAIVAMAAAILCLLLNFEVAYSTNFVVGDARGWMFGVVSWTNGKTFMAGDVLEFKYNPQMHNVVAVDENSYKSCTVPAGAKTYSSGDDKITLPRGKSFFICGIPGHCGMGMKIAVTAN